MYSARRLLHLLFGFSVVLGARFLSGQADPNMVAPSPYQSVDGSGIDHVNLTNGALQLDAPLASFKQRGALSLEFRLRYTAPTYVVGETCLPQQACTYSRSMNYSSVYVSSSTDIQLFQSAYVINNETLVGYYWTLVTPDGSSHKLANISSGVYRSVDATGWIYNENTHVLTSRDGVNYVFFVSSMPSTPADQIPAYEGVSLSYVEDTNGNRITLQYNGQNGNFSGWLDSVGRQIPVPIGYGAFHSNYGASYEYFGNGLSTDTSGCTGILPNTGSFSWTIPGYQGSETYKLCYATASVQVCSGPSASACTSSYNLPYSYLQSIVLPDTDENGKNETWAFEYTTGGSTVGGTLDQITLPEGGTISYLWGFVEKQFCSDLLPGSTDTYPKFYPFGIGSRTLTPNSGPAEVWTYSSLGEQVQAGSGTRTIVTTVQDLLGQKVVHTFTGLLNTCSYYETQTQYYDASANLVRTDATAYSSQKDIEIFLNGYPLAMGVVPLSKAETWQVNGATKQTISTWDTGFSANSYNSEYEPSASGLPYGQVILKTESDYGTTRGNPGPVLRKTNTTYLSSTDGTAFNNNLLDRPATVIVTDGITGSTQTTKYGYDESGLQSGGASSTTWNSNPLSSKRGNQTSVNRLWDTTGAYLPTTKAYFDTGELASIKDPLNHTTSFTYSSNYDAAYLTTATDALGHITQYGYDLNSGLLTSVTDPNSITATYGYDAASRLTSVKRPGGDHNLPTAIQYSYLDANDVQRTAQLTSSTPLETDITTIDGLGRTLGLHHVDPEGDTYVDTTYDLIGRKSTISTPYRSKADASFYGLTTYAYDLFDRTTNIKNPDQTSSSFQYSAATTQSTTESNSTAQTHTAQKLTKIDGLGRLIGVCEMTSVTPPVGSESPTACGMDIAGSGFLTTYTQTLRGITAIVQGAQTRSFSYDSLNQLTDATNPETGHVHYAYDSDGELTSKTAPAPNAAPGSTDTIIVNYPQYDALHRLKQKTYTAGNGASSAAAVNSTPSSYYAYDQLSVGSTTLENPIGRLTSETTALRGSLQTETIYSYDTSGHVASHYQCVLANCANYQDAEYDYDGEGNLTQLSTASNGFSLAYNQAGHLIGVTPLWVDDSNHPAQLFGAVVGQSQYAPNGLWATVQLGNGATESYTYQPRWLTGMNVNGPSLSIPAVAASTTIDITGTEGSKQIQTSAPVAPSGQITISGTERVNTAGQSATGAITISGSENSKQVLVTSATSATGTVAIGGNEGETKICPEPGRGCTVNYDTGTVTITVNGFAASTNFGEGSTSAALATALANALNASNSPVNASVSGSTIIMTTRSTGLGVNYSLLARSSSDFSVTASGSSLSGGKNAQYNTLYDSGTITIAVNGYSRSAAYGQGSTSNSIASSIAANFTCAGGSPAGGTVSGGNVIFTACTSGSAANGYVLSASVSYDTGDFASSSFGATGGQLTGGKDQTWDQGTLTVELPGSFSAGASFGQNSTSSSVASALVSALSIRGSPFTASVVSGSTVQITAKATGQLYNGAISIAVSGNYSGSSDFTASTTGLSGGQNAGTSTVYDQGVVTLSLNGASASASYGQSSTSASVAQALSSAINSAGMAVSCSNPQNSSSITLTATQAGTSLNGAVVSVTASSTQSQTFSSPSFGASPSSAALSGGVNGVNGPQLLYSFSLIHAPDGQVTNANDSINGNWSYTYDDFNRLQTASEVNANNNVVSALSWDYDRYGNRWHQNLTAGTGTSTQLTFNAATNQTTTNLVYDAAGNVLNDTAHNYIYDAENRISQVDGATGYIYDAEGRRVGKTGGTVYVVGLNGQVLDEFDGGTWKWSEVYAGGHHLATVAGQSVYFIHSDWLGTERGRSNVAGAICETLGSQPFGDDLIKEAPSNTTSCNPTPQFFTGKQRDAESNLDDFGARYFSSQWGRWMSPDWAAAPEPVPYANLANPQSLNLYAYVNNDPVDGEDPDGHALYPSGDGTDVSEEILAGQQAQNAATVAPASAGSTATSDTTQALLDKIAGKLESAAQSLALGSEEVTESVVSDVFGAILFPFTAVQSTGAGPGQDVIHDTGQGSGKSDPEPATATGGAGKGRVPPSDRDPKRYFGRADKAQLRDAVKGLCETCGKPTTPAQRPALGKKLAPTEGHAGHKEAWSRGGRTVLRNGKWQCRECNLKEGSNSQ